MVDISDAPYGDQNDCCSAAVAQENISGVLEKRNYSKLFRFCYTSRVTPTMGRGRVLLKMSPDIEDNAKKLFIQQ